MKPLIVEMLLSRTYDISNELTLLKIYLKETIFSRYDKSNLTNDDWF